MRPVLEERKITAETWLTAQAVLKKSRGATRQILVKEFNFAISRCV